MHTKAANQGLDRIAEDGNDVGFETLVRERSNPLPKGELCRLIIEGDIEAIRSLQKSVGAAVLKRDFFSRDNLQQTPLALALKHGDYQLISLLLSLGIPPHATNFSPCNFSELTVRSDLIDLSGSWFGT
jgi:hypothetical protein